MIAYLKNLEKKKDKKQRFVNVAMKKNKEDGEHYSPESHLFHLIITDEVDIIDVPFDIRTTSSRY